MTAHLALSVRIDFGADPTSTVGTQLVGSVTAVGSGAVFEGLLVPAGLNVKPLTIEVPPGEYLCEVVMPSGNLLNAFVGVESGETLPIEFDAADSPHEGYAWQRLSGNVESRSFESKRRVTGLATKQFFSDRPATLQSQDAAPVMRPVVGWIGAPAPASFSWTDLNELARTQGIADRDQLLTQLSNQGWLVVDPVDEDEGTALYRFTRTGSVAAPADQNTAGSRRFALVSGGVNAYLVTLPVPWIDPESGIDMPAEIMVEHRPSHRGSPISVTVRDPKLGSGLAYLAKGSLHEAAKVFSNAEDMLFDKMVNPIGAAAGAYVLVGANSGEDVRWHGWVSNLKQFHEWLPDGAILWATLKLRLAKDEASIETARAELLEAYGRGVPLYTLGLQWLVDGLSGFAEDDAASKEALAEVRRLARRVDMGQPFVVLRLNGVSR
ncbi:MAG TPA: hypothetical protein VF148_13610 [Acidimicrobiia bacterium]